MDDLSDVARLLESQSNVSETKKDFESPSCFRRLYCLLYTSPGGHSPPGPAWRVAIQMSTAVNMV